MCRASAWRCRVFKRMSLDAVLRARSGFYDSQPRPAGRYVTDRINVMLVEEIIEGLSIDSSGLGGGRDVTVVPLKELGYVLNFEARFGGLEFCGQPSRRRWFGPSLWLAAEVER